MFRSLFLAASLLLFSSFASAAYSFKVDGLNTFFTSGFEACQAGAVNKAGPRATGVAVSTFSFPTTASYVSCQFTYKNEKGADQAGGVNVYIYGTSCDVGTTYNPGKGSCDQSLADGEICKDQSGTNTPEDPMIFDGKQGKCVRASEATELPSCKYLAGKGNPGSAYQIAGTWDGGVPSAPPSFAQNGTSCEVSVVSSSDCVSDVKGNVLCNVIGKLTGNVNNQTNVIDAKDAACEGGVCVPVKEETSVTDKPCVYSGSGDSVSCTSETETQKDGKQSCGTVNGVRTCVFSQPSSNGIKIDTTVKTTDNSDGSKTSVKTDNATKTTCTGINKCSTTSSSTTTTTKTNGSGQTTSTDTKCTGTCGSSGTGIQPGSGSGSGDGEEDGSGDGAGLTDPENGSFDGQGDEWDQKISDSKTELKESLAKLKEAFSPVGDITLGGGGQLYCPPSVTVLGHSIDFCLDKYAGSLSWIASAIFALCAMVALMIVFA